MTIDILMVAEKPAAAKAVAEALSYNTATRLTSIGKNIPVWVCNGEFKGKPARFKITSTTGHLFERDFTGEFRNWDSDPSLLFDAPTQKNEAKMSINLAKQISQTAKNCSFLILWLDCDREGENICFEVISSVQHNLISNNNQTNIYRAKFSSLEAVDVRKAFKQLVLPNKNLSDAVDARQEIDLKIGVAFTRFQTKYFQDKYGDLNSKILSYGPCQTPTLYFCVKRYDEINNFQPENYFTLKITLSYNDVQIFPTWTRGPLFDESAATFFKEILEKNNENAIIKSISSNHQTKHKPLPLDTLSLLKKASNICHISPHSAMQIAEKLYLQKIITYPRTESTAYPSSYDAQQFVKMFENHQIYGQNTQQLLNDGLDKRQRGVDMKDHPPITPLKSLNENEFLMKYNKIDWEIYKIICTSFLCSFASDAHYLCTTMQLLINGEICVLTHKHLTKNGFLAFKNSNNNNYQNYDDDDNNDDDDDNNNNNNIQKYIYNKNDNIQNHQNLTITNLFKNAQINQTIPLKNIQIIKHETTPPPYLSEADLIECMRKNGIGTDASIPQHIQNIQDRNYVTLTSNRRLQPTKLGLTVIHGFDLIDRELILPNVRSAIETHISVIADGKAKMQDVIDHSLMMFKNKFDYFCQNIEKVDTLYEVSFTKLAETGSFFSRCGHCKHYMTLINKEPIRLYCKTCNKTYKMPTGGSVKLFQELKCPLDDFELVYFSIKGGKSYPLCPYCYCYPPFQTYSTNQTHMNCLQCSHPTCQHSYLVQKITDCYNENCNGLLCLEVLSEPKWKMACNCCQLEVKFFENAKKIKVSSEKCEVCDFSLLIVQYSLNNTPWKDGEVKMKGCIQCTIEMSSLVEEVSMSRFRSIRNFRGRKARGGGFKRGRKKHIVYTH